ncbi:lysophospholipase L1-like esterase [Metabacillus malikii]|uniref:Lysophospholipase L1-like esterase n=1 Tax=Metabacillus malikii TaxID=1504265 RepID=A0ABT9ZBD8_9BACI|nr:lysophospholipase L1-like esterase [Metabacillus malikii]
MRVFLAGDSTVQAYEDNARQGGWGEFLHKYLDDNIQVCNYAIGGRSSKTFVEEGRLEHIFSEISESDYLLVQMGHNDATKHKPERYTEPYTTYKKYINMYIEGAKSLHANPILITPVARLHVKQGQFINDFPEYCIVLKDLAKSQNIPLIDLMNESLNFYASVGYERAEDYFMASINKIDFTHFTKLGANEIAKIVARQLTYIWEDLKDE